MATISEISNLDSYVGSAALGGANEIAINIDTKPIQQLAAYTLMYNKSQYDQRQKDADEKIKQLGALAPYDLINGIEKDAEELKSAQAKLTEEMAAFAAKGTPKTPAEKIQQKLDFQKKITGQVKLIDAANARKIKLDAYKNATQADTKLSAQEKELRIKQAEKLFNDTDINTLPEIPNYDLSKPKNGDAAIETVAVLKNDKDGNAVIDETITQFSIGNTWKNAYLHGNGLAIPTLPANATEQQKAEYEQQKLAFSKTGMGAWQSAAEVYNAALADPNYKVTETTSDINVIGAPAVTKLTETVDVNKIKQGNPIMGGVLALAERYNAYAEKRLQDIKQGYYIDDVTGEKVLLVGGDKEADVKFIDVTKPLKPEDLAFLDMFARAAPDKVDKKYTATDNARQEAMLAETKRNNNLDFKVAWKNANKPSGGGGSDKPEVVISQPAILFGEHINRLKSTFEKNNNTPIVVPFKSVDEKTRVATKLKDKQYIVYKPDGSYVITTDKKGVDNKKTVSVGTIDNIAQGFIDAVKTIDLDASKDKDGTMAEGFQVKSEAFFNQTFGTTSGRTIWDGWNGAAPAPAATTPATTKPAGTTMSDEEYKKFLKANGL